MGEKATIRVGHLKITDHLILGMSKDRCEKGEEQLQHVSLETVPMLGWKEVADALSNGDINAAFVLAPTAMNLFNAGVKIKMTLFTHKTGSILITNKQANIKSIQDFAGKVVIIPYQLSVHHMLLHKMLSEAGLTPGKDVMLEVMAPSQMPMAIQYDEEGEVAGFIVAEPFGSQAVLEGYGEEFAMSKDLWPGHPCCVLVMHEDLTEGHPDATLELVKSLVTSGNLVAENPSAAAAVGAAFLGQKEEVIKRVLTEPPDRILTTELMPILDDLNQMQNYMYDTMGVLRNKIDMEKFVDTRFAVESGAK